MFITTVSAEVSEKVQAHMESDKPCAATCKTKACTNKEYESAGHQRTAAPCVG